LFLSNTGLITRKLRVKRLLVQAQANRKFLRVFQRFFKALPSAVSV
jgi:hypothetical protein